jgi:hypothetical protein
MTLTPLKAIIFAVLFGLNPFVSLNLRAQTPDVRQYVLKARAAYKDKDYAALIENMKAALAIRPNAGPFIYNIAVGYVLSGNNGKHSIGWAVWRTWGSCIRFQETATLRQSKTPTNSKIVARSKITPGHREQHDRLHSSRKGIYSEGLAYDPAERIFYLAVSTRER